MSKSLKSKQKAFREACMNCVTHMLRLTNIWKTISTNKRGNNLWKYHCSTCSFEEKNNILGYEDLTQKQQEQARTLPKGIYLENIMIQLWMLQSTTTISPTVQTDALSDIDINSPPAIHREPKNPLPTHVRKIQHCPSKIL
jgi:hypothetical protein